jgi:hypothetical protein
MSQNFTAAKQETNACAHSKCTSQLGIPGILSALKLTG